MFLWDDGIAKTLLTSRDCDVDNFDRARRLNTEPPRKITREVAGEARGEL